MSQRGTPPGTTPNSSGQSTPPPPSSYRSSVLGNSATLLGLGASAIRPLRNRLSRNFEDILREDETVQLRAGNLDESKLGVVFTPPASRTGAAGDYSFSTTISTDDDDEQPLADYSTTSPTAMPRLTRNTGQPTFNLQPATPIVVPPTPLASNSPADPSAANTTIDSSVEDSLEHARASLLPVSQPPTPASSNASKRRSLLRSPGTSSSPDLATLVRKARERGGIVGSGGNSSSTNSNDNSAKPEIPTTPAAARPTTSTGTPSQPVPEVVVDPSGSSKQSRPATSSGPSSFLAPNANNNRMRTTSSTSSFSIVNTPDPTSSYTVFGGSNASTARLASATISAGSSKKLHKQASIGVGSGSDASPLKGISGGKEPPKQSSMRSKANTFLKQFMSSGSSNNRDKKRALSLTASLQPLPPNDSNAPPVPPLPSKESMSTMNIGHSRMNSKLAQPIVDDVFTTSESDGIINIDKGGSGIAPPPPSNESKPRPSVSSVRPNPDPPVQSPSGSLFPENYSPVKPRISSSQSPHIRRRSASIGSIDFTQMKLDPSTLTLGPGSTIKPRKSSDSAASGSRNQSHLRDWDLAMRGLNGLGSQADDFSGAFRGMGLTTSPAPTPPRKDRASSSVDTTRNGTAAWGDMRPVVDMHRGASAPISHSLVSGPTSPIPRPSESSTASSAAWRNSDDTTRTSESGVSTRTSGSTSTATALHGLRRSSGSAASPSALGMGNPSSAAASPSTLRLVSGSSVVGTSQPSGLHPRIRHRPESIPIPDNNPYHNLQAQNQQHLTSPSSGISARRTSSPTNSTPTEDVFFDAESTRSSFSATSALTKGSLGGGTTSSRPNSAGTTGNLSSGADGIEPTTPIAPRLQIPGNTYNTGGASSHPSLSIDTSRVRSGSGSRDDEPHSAGSSTGAGTSTGAGGLKTPVFPRRPSVRLPQRSPNPFQMQPTSSSSRASSAGYSMSPISGLSGNGGAGGRSASLGVEAISRAGGSGASSRPSQPNRSSTTIPVPTGLTSASTPSVGLPRPTGRASTNPYAQSRSAASASEPLLVATKFATPSGGVGAGISSSSAGRVGEDGRLVASPHAMASEDGDESSDANATSQTIRLVGPGIASGSGAGMSSNSSTLRTVSGVSTLSTGSSGTGGTSPTANSATTPTTTLGSSSLYAHSASGYSGYSMSSYSHSTTDLMLSRYPSSTRMAAAAAAGALSNATTMDPEEIEAKAKENASRIWGDDETLMPLEKYAEWLGGRDPVKTQALKHYMEYFDFTGLRLEAAFRHLCGKLFLRAETQQVDRILECFSTRFWECNPQPIYRDSDTIHAMTYSLMLLNTDLHVAEISSRMSRNQFIKNTINVVFAEKKPQDLDSPMSLPGAAASTTTLGSDDGDLAVDPDDDSTRASGSTQGNTGKLYAGLQHKKRSGSLTSWRNVMQNPTGSHSAVQLDSQASDSPEASRVSLNLPPGSFDSPVRRGSRDALVISNARKSWEAEVENLLKEMYDSIKKQQILQPTVAVARASTSSLTPSSPLSRARSHRNTPSSDRLNNLKRGSVRGLQSLLANQSAFNTSSPLDGRISPSPSYVTSIGETLAAPSSSFYAPTLGFASNLSHSIIKETTEDDARSIRSVDTASTSVSISDEELALLGAPWAKEGMLCRKQYWETAKRKAKTRNWMDVFVVISKGDFSMFTFGENGPSSAVSSFGGGNWLSNANLVGEFSLAHSLAHALPSPGYNRQRPHCFVLTLSSGAVFFFQAGTEELITEWVSTCNYWAARQSREPLSGGVSNMEYGWNRILQQQEDGDLPTPNRDNSDNMSIRSGRSGRLGRYSTTANRSINQTMPADRLFIHEWKPPMPPSLASTNDEEAQLESLQKQVEHLQNELEKHNVLQKPMQDLFAPRSANAAKAMNNWELKSQHLLSESVKYQSYVESLREGMSLRLKRRGERALERALQDEAESDDEGAEEPASQSSSAITLKNHTSSSSSPSSTNTGTNILGRRASAIRSTVQMQETIQEADEPTTPNASAFMRGQT